MLISFRVKNFRSIVDATMDMSYAEGKAPNGYREMETIPFLEAGTPKRERVVPCLALYGPNAGGKTNLIRAMWNFVFFLNLGASLAFDPNRLLNAGGATKNEVEFVCGERRYKYLAVYCREQVFEESLAVDGKYLFRIKAGEKPDFGKIVSGIYNAARLEEILSVECSEEFLGNPEQFRANELKEEEALRYGKKQRISFLAKIARNYPGLNADIARAYDFLVNRIDVYRQNEFPSKYGIERLAKECTGENTLNMAFERIAKAVRTLDLGIKRMTLWKAAAPENFYGGNGYNGKPAEDEYIIHAIHEDENGREIEFDFNEESTGTRAAFGLLGVLLAALEKGRTVVIDELDRSLHPFVFRELVRLFKDKRYNKKNAQLIFTAHNLDLLDSEILRISEIGIVDKTLKGGTTLTRLSDFDGIRNVTNFRHQYLNGAFSGIPSPYL